MNERLKVLEELEEFLDEQAGLAMDDSDAPPDTSADASKMAATSEAAPLGGMPEKCPRCGK